MKKYVPMVAFLFLCQNLCLAVDETLVMDKTHTKLSSSKYQKLIRTKSSFDLSRNEIGDIKEIYGYKYLIKLPNAPTDHNEHESQAKAKVLLEWNLLNMPIYELGQKFGVEEINGVKVINVSYPYLLRYAASLNNETINALIEQLEVENAGLFQLAMNNLFEVSEGDSGNFKLLFDEMVSNATGMQRVKALILLNVLNDNKKIGSPSYRGKKLKVRLNDDEGSSYYSSHSVAVGSVRPIKKLILGKTDGDRPERMADAFTHELGHAYHAMLGLSPASRNVSSLCIASVFADKFFREKMFPLLNKKICGQVLEGLRANENIKELKLDWKKIKNDSVFCEGYNFLEANNFFNNELLNLDSNDDGNQPDAARMIVVYMAAMSVSAWSNLEEMLTIIGIAPIWHRDANTNNLLHKYVLADNQSESNYLERWHNAWRLFHCVFSNLVYFTKNKTIIDNIRQTLSDVIAGLYPSWQVKDGAINQEFSVVNDYREITPQEVREAVKAIIAKCGTVTLENVREYANKVLEEEEAEFVIAQNAKGEAKQDISLSAYVNFNDESTWEKALEDHFIDNDIRLKEVSKLGYFNISPGNSLSQLIKEKTKDDNEQITLNLPEIRNVVVKGLDWYKQNFKSHYAEYIEPIRLQLISNEFLLKLLKAAREKEEKERKQAEEKKRIEEERKQAEEKKRIEEERKEKKRKEEEELAFVRIEDGEAEAKQDITLSAYVNFNDKSTWEKALEDHFIDNDIRLKEVSKLGYFSTSPGKLLFDLIKGKAKGGGTITLNLSEMRNVVVKGLDWYKQNFKSHYAKYIEPIRQELISNEFLLKLLNIASEKAEKKKN